MMTVRHDLMWHMAVVAGLLAGGCGSLGVTDDFGSYDQEHRARRSMQQERQDSVGGHLARGRERWGPTKPPTPILDEASGLSDYLVYAALNNPGLEAMFNRWKATLERIPQAKALPDPRLKYGYYIREVETRVGPQRQRLGLAQTFPWFGKLRLRGDAASEAAQEAKQRYEAVKLKLFYSVKDAYYEYYYLGRAIGVVRAQLDYVKYLEQVVRTRYRTAATKHSDLIRAQVELGKLDDRLRSLVDLREPVVARLNAVLNRPVSAPLPWPTEIPYEQVEGTDEQVFAWFLEVNPDLRGLEHAIAREQYGLELAMKNYYPDVTFGVDYIETGSAIMRTSESGKDPVIAMVSINLPIWLGKLRAGVREAEARHRAAVHAKKARENTLSAAIKMALYKFRDARRKIDLYRDTLVPKGKQSLEASATAFRGGTASFLDVVDAVRILLEFELSYERALADRAQRLAELEMLVGRELPMAVPPGAEESERSAE